MKNYILWAAIGFAICANFGCGKPNPPYLNANYIVVNNTDDSVRLAYRTTRYFTNNGGDSITNIARLLRGERKTIYQSNWNNYTSNIYEYALSDDYRGYLYGLKGSKPDTIRGKRWSNPSLSYPYYWRVEKIDDNTVNRVLTLY